MPSINKCIVLLSLALSVVAANHGNHLSRNIHHDVAARAPVAAPVNPIAAPLQKRASNSKRCKARSSSSSSSSTTTHQTSSTKTSSTHSATTTSKKAAKADAEPTPTSTSTSSSSKYTPPPPTSTHHTTTSSSKAATSTGSSSSSGLTVGGIATYFLQNGVAGACGTVHPDSAIVCALQTQLYDNGSNCGKTVAITNMKNGKTVNVLVADECPTCDNSKSIDLSKGAFTALGGTEEEGVFPIGFVIL